MSLKAFICGSSGPELTDQERLFFRETRPCGLILFARNCVDPGQLRRLVEDFHGAVGETGLMVLIDQEGGRVRRLKPPHWRALPPARAFGQLHARDSGKALEAAYLVARLTAQELAGAGVNVNCAPVLDIPAPGAHEIIGDRAYGTDPQIVADLGGAVARGFLDGGVLPVMKHIPGHGRAGVDSHKSLPVIDADRRELAQMDFKPFAELRDLPVAMTAHVLIPDIDAERPASLSPAIIGQVIRDQIGFDGLLMCDDLSMGALEGPVEQSARQAISAGVDVALHCNGDIGEMTKIAEVVPELDAKAMHRFEAALGRIGKCKDFDEDRAKALLDEVAALA